MTPGGPENPDKPDSHDDLELEGQLNQSLNDVLDLLANEVERLKVQLEFYRLSNRPDRDQLIKHFVDKIDARQDRMDEIKALIIAKGDLLH